MLYNELDNGGKVDTTYYYIDLLTTQMDSHKKEYQTVLVVDQFDPEAAKLFRTFQKNNNCFKTEGLHNLRWRQS